MLLAMVACVAGCDFGGITAQLAQTNVELHNVVDTFDRAIDALARQSSDWQVVLQSLEEQIVDDVQSTTRVELQNLMRTGLLGAGGEFRCDADFLRLRMRRELLRIRNDLVRDLNALGLEIPLLFEPAPEPHICSAVPAAVNLGLDEERRVMLDIYGFDLRSMPITVEVVTVNGNRRNVTGSLGVMSDQQMVLDLTQSGAALTDESHRIVFSWNRRPQSVIRILNPAAQITCVTRTRPVEGDPETFIPPHTRGDRDFKGHGPCVRFWLNLRMDVERTRIWADYRMRAWECSDDYNKPKKDHTTADGSSSVTLFSVANPNQRILGHNLETSFFHEYIDNDHQSDQYTFAGLKPIEKLIYVGDTKGSEAGSRTQVEMFFRRMQVVVEECEGNGL
jgi:hypothetical protein